MDPYGSTRTLKVTYTDLHTLIDTHRPIQTHADLCTAHKPMWNMMEHKGTEQNNMERPGTFWKKMIEPDGTSWNLMEHHRTPPELLGTS